MSIAPLRIYTQPNFEGTEYSFTDADRGQVLPLTNKGLTGNYSVKIAEGYVYKTYNINSNIWLSGDIANLSLTAQDEVYLSIFFIFQKVAAQIGDIYIFTHQVNDYQNFTPFDPTWTSLVSITTQPFYVVEIKNTQTNSISLTTFFTNSTVQSSFGFSDPAEYEFRLVGGINESLPVIPIARVYNGITYNGTEFKFTEINVDTLYAFSDYSINGNFSTLLTPGYGLEVVNPSSGRRWRYPESSLSIIRRSSFVINELGTHFYIRKIAASFVSIPNALINSFMINDETNFSRGKISTGDNSYVFPSLNETIVVHEGYSLTVDNTQYAAGTYTLNVSSSIMSVGMIIPYWKRVQLNLYDTATNSLRFQINQKYDSTKFNLSTNLTFVDANNSRNISDVLDYLERVVSVETDINFLKYRTGVNDTYIDLLEGRASVSEADIDSLETRASVNEADLVTLDSRSDSNASRLLVDDSELSALEAYIDALEGRANAIKSSSYSVSSELQSFPPTMSSNTSPSGYVASASSIYDNNNPGFLDAFSAFDGSTASLSFWSCVDSSAYGGSTGDYVGSTTTQVNSNTVYGEWLQISLPNMISLSHFSITPRSDFGLYANRSPEDFIVVGSNDELVWTQLYSTTGQVYSDTSAVTFNVTPVNEFFNTFRIIITKSGGGAQNNNSSVQISEWMLYGYPVSEMTGSISVLENRANTFETDITALTIRSDSNASRLLIDDSELSALEAYVDALEGRASVNETDIDLLETRASVNEADIDALESRADSNAARLSVDDSELSALEAYVDALETRTSTTETDIVNLENSFTNYEADVVDIKGTLYAISDGNIESMLSSLHEITDSFVSETNSAEDMAELHARLAELESVIQELTME